MNLPEWEGHHWERPKSVPCPHCPCCVAHVCREKTWTDHFWPIPDKPCPCQSKATEWSVLNGANFLIPVDPRTMKPFTRESAIQFVRKFNREAAEAGMKIRAVVQNYGVPVEITQDEAAS